MGSPQKTDPATILSRLQQRLIDRLVTARAVLADSSSVGIIAGDPRLVPHWCAPFEVLLSPAEENARDEFYSGAGRYDSRSLRSFQVTVRTRLDLDQTGRDVTRMTSTSLGHLILEWYVKDALQGLTPTVNDTDDLQDLTDYPLHWRGTSRPVHDPQDHSWVSSTLTFECGYVDDLDQDDPALR